MKKLIYYLSVITTIIYITYRILFTIPKSNIITISLAILVLIVEGIDALFYIIYTFNILIQKKEYPIIPTVSKNKYPNIDIFIATINESKELLKETIISCKSMKYPNSEKVHIYICDDGNREEIKELADELNVHYITRNSNDNAKAGNYNHALNKTKSPYIVTFDADMSPTNDFLLKALPFLIENNNIGFIQYPQSFKDLDIFQRKFKLSGKIPYEQDYFYHKIQMAKNNTNCVICCGTNTIYSRKALRDIGGFATKTITEDIATGMLIEEKGYQAIAIPDNEAYGINVISAESLFKQRSRWCRGCIQTLKNYKILFNNNLSLRQKLDYLSAIYYWSFGIRNIFYMIIPLLFSFFDIRIIQSNIIIFLLLFFIQFIFKRFIIDIIENNYISSTWNRIYEIILSPVIAYESIKELLGLGNLKFEVTEKQSNKKSFPYRSLLTYLIHLVLLVLTVLGTIISYYKGKKFGFTNYILPLFWLITNSLYLLIALIFDNSNIEEIEQKHTNKYSIFALPILFFKYIKHQIKIKEKITIILLFILLFNFISYIKPSTNYQSVSYNGYLTIKDGKLVNKKKEPIQLRGVSTHNLYYYKDLYNYENIKELVKTWNINVFRISIYTDPNEEGYIKNRDIKNKIEEIINYCIDLDIYVILDWHILSDNNPMTYKQDAIEFFNEMSKKYQDVPNILYEICNEPNGDEVTWNNEIKPYAEELIETIRNNYSDSIILVGTANWSKDLESVRKNPIKDENTMYVVHTYDKGGIDEIKSGMINAMNEKLPIMVTECAATNPTGDGKINKNFLINWIDYLEKNNISWIIWQFSDKKESSSLLLPKKQKEKNYSINSYLSEEGKLVKKIIIKYTKKALY